MTTLYGLYGENSHDFLTLGGRVIVHDHAGEMQHLFPDARIREVPQDIRGDQTLSVRQHPDLCSIAWDDNGRLVPGQFRDGS
jgi:hypothetical protein